ncbi:MAG: hypothetical protein CMB64_05005 [Euryarchaeota archaeon]|nr:hypothetical protein [Euryarchaeota archaeon]
MHPVEADDRFSPFHVSKKVTCSMADVSDYSLAVNEYLSGNAIILLGSCCTCNIEEIAQKLESISMVHDWKTKEYEFHFSDYSTFNNVNYPFQDIVKLNMTVSKESNEINIHVRGNHGYRKNTYIIQNSRGGKSGWRMTYTGFIHENLTQSRKWTIFDRLITYDPCMIVNKIMFSGFTRLQYHGELTKLVNGTDIQDIEVLGLLRESTKHMITSQKNVLLLLFHCDKVKAGHNHLQTMAPFTQADDTHEKMMRKNPELCLTQKTVALVTQRIKESYDKLIGGQPAQKKVKLADPKYDPDKWVLDENYPIVSEPKTNYKLMVKIMFFEIEKIIQFYFWCTESGLYPISMKNGKKVSCIESNTSDKFTSEQICHVAIRHVDHMALDVHKECCFLCQRGFWSEHRKNPTALIFFQYMITHLTRANPHKTLFNSVDFKTNEDGFVINDNIIAFSSWNNSEIIYFDFIDQTILSQEEMTKHKWFAATNKIKYRLPKGVNLDTLHKDIKDLGFYDHVVQFCKTLPHMYFQSSAITKMILLMFGIGLARLPHQIFFIMIGDANMGKSEIKRILQECISDPRKVRHMDNGIHSGNFGVSMLAGDKDVFIVTFDEIPSKSFNHTQLLQSVDRMKIGYNKKGNPDAQEGQIPFMIWACNEFFDWTIKDSVLRRAGVINFKDLERKNIEPSPVEAILADDHEARFLVFIFEVLTTSAAATATTTAAST